MGEMNERREKIKEGVRERESAKCATHNVLLNTKCHFAEINCNLGVSVPGACAWAYTSYTICEQRYYNKKKSL